MKAGEGRRNRSQGYGKNRSVTVSGNQDVLLKLLNMPRGRQVNSGVGGAVLRQAKVGAVNTGQVSHSLLDCERHQ